jgi:DNA-binding SARP family transcriptional activator
MTLAAPLGSLTVSRPRLSERVERALGVGHVAVVAPAGYGKTTVAIQAIAGRPLAGWHVCRRGHTEPLRLLSGLAAAVDRAQPGLAGRVLDALADPGDVFALARLLVRDLERLLVDELVLVVDDGELIAGAEDAVALLDLLLDEAQRLRLLLISRVELPLASPAALGMARLGTRELVFTADDAADLLSLRLGREAGDDEVRALLDRTLGWPLGIALGAGEADDPEALARRLLDRVDDGVREALLDSSGVDELTPSVVRALGLGFDVLAAGRSAGLVPRPGLRDGSLAWHPLVREALRAAWRSRASPERRADVLGRAGRALVADGQTLAGVEALVAGGDHAAALAALLADGDRLLRRSPGAVAELAAALPADAPAARLLRGWLDAVRGHAAAAVGPLQEGLGGVDLAAGAGARLALCESLYFLGRLDEAIAEAGVLADADDAPLPHAIVAAAWRALFEAAAGRVEAARVRIGEVLARDRTGVGAGLLAAAASMIEAPAGRHDVAIAGLDEAYARLAGRERDAGRPEYLTSLSAFIAADAGRREEAARRADRMITDREPDGLPPFVQSLAHGLQAWTRSLAGDLDGAEFAFAAAEAAGPPDGWPFAFALGSRAVVAAERGQGEQAREAAAHALRVGASMPDSHFAWLVAELGAAMLVAGEPGAAETMLAAAVERLPPDAVHPRARARLLRAAAASARGAEAVLDGTPAAALATDWRHARALAWAALPVEAIDAVPAADLVAFAGHADAAVRAAVAPRLARSGHPRTLEVLRELSRDESPEVARAAAAAAEELRARPAPLRFTLLGGFSVARGAWPLDERAWKRPTAARLVRYLLVHGGGPVDEDRVATDLWPDHDGEAARGALRMAVSRARQVLDTERSGDSLLLYRDRAYRLVLGRTDEVDAWRYRALAEAALEAEGPQRRLLLSRVEEAWTGEPLPEERYADWAGAWREELFGLRRRVLFALAHECRRAGDEHAVATLARRVLAHDELDEGAHRLLITALARSGQRSLALRQYLECRRRLIDALGLEPEAETAELQQRLLAGHAV